jgi:predicted lipoprotein
MSPERSCMITEAIYSNIRQIAVHLNKHKQQYDGAKISGTA